MTTATNTGRTSKQVHKSTDCELTEAQLHQITGGTTPSIPVPPPTPHAYARGSGNSTMQSDVNPQ
jgi:large exoprotein involved in heme utilization and adhesion